MSLNSAEFKYFLLADVNLNVKMKINSLKGKEINDLISSGGFGSEVFVTCSICFNGRAIGLPASTSHQVVAPNRSIRWDEWLTFPVKYRDLPAKSCLVFTVWQLTSQDGLQPNLSYKPPQDSGAIPVGGTTLPLFNGRGVLKTGHRRLFLWRGKEGDPSDHSVTPYKAWKARGMEKLHKVIRKYDQNELRNGFWLDSLAVRRLQKLQDQNFEYDRFVGRAIGIADPPNTASTSTTDVDQFGSHIFLTVEAPPFKHPIIYSQNMYAQRLQEILPFDDKNRLFVLHDPEMKRENPIENMYLKLARSIKGQMFIDIRPKIDERKQLENIINSPNRQLSGAEKQLLVTFRYFLLENKRALTKYLRAVYWDVEAEVAHALELIPKWAPIDIADALELLSSSFLNPEVRKYAVDQLKRAEDDELQSYLLQLVQALRFEKDKEKSYLAKFLIERCATSLELANYFHWYLTVEKEDRRCSEMFQQIHRDFFTKLSETTQGQDWEANFRAQDKLVHRLELLGVTARTSARKVEKRVERMRALLGADFKDLCSFEKTRMPVRPEIECVGVIPDKCTMFKSALAPMCITLSTPKIEPKEYQVLLKSGDDLRQDQLVIQMINLMDSILKKVKLDLKLTPYRVLASSPSSGFVEFVPDSSNLSKILDNHNKNIGDFFQKNNKPSDMQKVLETFVKSTAGYCVITYILGIGDRHLDNIMLTKTGHLFHIDFGYIFGRDPKPFPPPIKFCKEMVEAMGGADSPQYHDFRRYCCLAYNILRKHANLILNLLGLMAEADIPNVSADMDKILVKVQDKFRLDLTDEEAEHYLLNLIDESMNALFPQIMDKVHKWAMYWK